MSSPKSKTRKITNNQYLQIVGLLTLSRENLKVVENITKILKVITGEKEDWGHCSDAIYEDYTADELLKKLGIEVKK